MNHRPNTLSARHRRVRRMRPLGTDPRRARDARQLTITRRQARALKGGAPA